MKLTVKDLNVNINKTNILKNFTIEAEDGEFIG